MLHWWQSYSAFPEPEAAQLLEDLEVAGCLVSATGPVQ
jgi:hypothetical protein